MTPTEALEQTIMYAMACSIHREPGRVVARMPEHVREALRELRAEDTQVRVDAVYDLPRKKRQ